MIEIKNIRDLNEKINEGIPNPPKPGYISYPCQPPILPYPYVGCNFGIAGGDMTSAIVPDKETIQNYMLDNMRRALAVTKCCCESEKNYYPEPKCDLFESFTIAMRTLLSSIYVKAIADDVEEAVLDEENNTVIFRKEGEDGD